MLPQGFRSHYRQTAEALPNGGVFGGGVVLSILLHILVFLLLLWHPNLVEPEPEEPPPPPVEMVYEAPPTAESVRSPIKAEVPAPPAVSEVKAPPSPTPPVPEQPIAPPPPSPPPPVHARPVPQVIKHQVEKVEKTEPHKTAPTSVEDKRPVAKAQLAEKGEVSKEEVKKKPTKNSKEKKDDKPVKAQSHAKADKAAKAVHSEAEKNPDQKTPSKDPSSHTTQTHQMAKTQEDSHSLLATLDSFRSEQKQVHAQSAKANPAQGGSPHGGGSPDGDTRALTGAQQKAIGTSVRRCYQEDTAAKDYASFVAHLIVTVDATGVARLVSFAPETKARMQSDASYRALAERARDAVLSPTCAHLPIPAKLLGQTRQLRFVFRP